MHHGPGMLVMHADACPAMHVHGCSMQIADACRLHHQAGMDMSPVGMQAKVTATPGRQHDAVVSTVGGGMDGCRCSTAAHGRAAVSKSMLG
jgi:hypothetical protein